MMVNKGKVEVEGKELAGKKPHIYKETKKPIIIGLITIVLVAALVTLLFFSEQFVGKAIETSVGSVIMVSNKDVVAVNGTFDVIISANPGVGVPAFAVSTFPLRGLHGQNYSFLVEEVVPLNREGDDLEEFLVMHRQAGSLLEIRGFHPTFEASPLQFDIARVTYRIRGDVDHGELLRVSFDEAVLGEPDNPVLPGSLHGVSLVIGEEPDGDGDGVYDMDDNCPLYANAPADCDSDEGTSNEQCDSDGDGVGDVCDACEGFDDNMDFDGDGVPNGCDTDDDEDGIPDADDDCDTTPAGGIVVERGCTEDELNALDADGDGVGAVTDCDDDNPEVSVEVTQYEDADGDMIRDNVDAVLVCTNGNAQEGFTLNENGPDVCPADADASHQRAEDCAGFCAATNDGVERCDGADNDCNSIVDDVAEAALQSDVNNCGSCETVCAEEESCVEGSCILVLNDEDDDGINDDDDDCQGTPDGANKAAASLVAADGCLIGDVDKDNCVDLVDLWTIGRDANLQIGLDMTKVRGNVRLWC